jgi:multiple antibiotic resistance protein
MPMDDALRIFVAMFIILDPVGNLFLFHLLTFGVRQRRRMAVALAAVTVAAVLLALFSFGGPAALSYLGISTPAFTVAAGLLLLMPAYQLVVHGQLLELPAGGPDAGFQVAFVPLAMPLIAGPGALAATASFSESYGRYLTLGVVAAVLAMTWVGFALSALAFRVLGEAVLRLLARTVGILLFSLAVEFVLRGVTAALR